MVKTIGEELMKRSGNGELCVRIASIFPKAKTLVALPEMPLHAYQRASFADSVNQARLERGEPPLSAEQYQAEMDQAVDLLVNDQGVLIRPDPSRMDLALAADELLQELVPKRLIQYLLLSDSRVRDALKQRGECWRMFLPPTAPKQIRRMIAEAKSGIGGKPIYYYSPISGTRFLTYESFRKLAEFDDADLRAHLIEIATYCKQHNGSGFPEVEFFMADPAPAVAELESLSTAPPEELRSRFQAMCQQLKSAVPPEYQCDDLDDPPWRKRVFVRLVTRGQDARAEDQSMGLDLDFSMRVEWLPGARIEDGELIIDAAIEESSGRQQDQHVSTVLNGLILNAVQEFGDLEYINLGSVLPSANRNEHRAGRREVYVAQIKHRRSRQEVLQVIRMQRWGVRERLDQGCSLEKAMEDSEEYTEYVLDRRLACRQLGMNLPGSQIARKVAERYDGSNARYAGRRIWSPYFQRDYIAGAGTDQISARRLADPEFALSFTQQLGRAAASNILVGRAEIIEGNELPGPVIFDVGDEIVVDIPDGITIVVSDYVGTFVDWKGSLASRAAEYAGPVVRRLKCVPEPRIFADSYVSEFVSRFAWIQAEYDRHRRAFDKLFKHRPLDSGGSPAYRWQCVLERLRNADAKGLGELIRKEIGI